MGATVSVSVGWALWGKADGSSRDFSVLGSSAGLLGKQGWEKVLARLTPATPPERQGLPGSLPWVMIGWVGIAKRPYLSVAIQESTQRQDRSGRAAPQTRCFCAPYAELENTPVCYGDLYERG